MFAIFSKIWKKHEKNKLQVEKFYRKNGKNLLAHRIRISCDPFAKWDQGMRLRSNEIMRFRSK
jgi:hypothetical protein